MPFAEKKCVKCGKKFEPTHGRQQSCTDCKRALIA